MGKKDSKKVDALKAIAKKQRQDQKQQKTTIKRTKKELRDGGEKDIESILQEFAAKEATRTAVSITVVPQPSRRSSFSFNAQPNGEMIMFGGEFFDGETTTVYNELLKWNVEKNEWRLIESLNTPPPRCSHQSVIYQDKMYVFGGEYGTLDQFYHYRDFWELDLKTNAWKEVEATGDWPSARSGHRMVLWRNYIILFGGFYEAMREVRWHNDLYFYSIPERRWTIATPKLHSMVPKPRSGHQLFLHPAEDILFVHGGFAKEKKAAGSFGGGGGKTEGIVLEDMWFLPLKPLLPSAAAGAASTSQKLDLTKLQWQRIAKKGEGPSARCGSVINVYRGKALLFGGVFDIQGPRHSMISTFYNDLYAFDLERRRWYQLGLKLKKEQLQKGGGGKKVKGPAVSQARAAAEDNDCDNSDDDDDEEEEEIIVSQSGQHQVVRPGTELFGYIDETGQVVYLEIAKDDEEGQPAQQKAATSIPLTAGSEAVSVLPNDMSTLQIASHEVPPPIPPSSSTGEKTADQTGEQADALQDGEQAPTRSPLPVVSSAADFANYFIAATTPCPRINPCLLIRGNSLLVYGGVFELGDVEVTLDDCWALDLNRREEWRCILPGTMTQLDWKGGQDDDENESRSTHSRARDEDDDEEGDESDEDDEDGGSDDGDDNDNHDDEGKEGDDQDVLEEVKPAKKSKKAAAPLGRRAQIEALRAHLDAADANRTPLAGETLRIFYSRTTEYWTQTAIQQWRDKGETDDRLGEKEAKREAFLLAEARFKELEPLLQELDELEAEQTRDEERFGGNGGRKKESVPKGGSGKSGVSNNNNQSTSGKKGQPQQQQQHSSKKR